ncbi:MAG TPA: hypothetical protein VNS63_05360 [Blastocatellia bacterium]|nr:hypothetical protein [Blastocatellia bacterium]
MKTTVSASVWLLIVALVLGLAPGPAAAHENSGGEDRPVRLRVTARFSPIGSIVGNLTEPGAAMIDGRIAAAQQHIWGGELLQAPTDATVRVSFDLTGEAALATGALARFGVIPADNGAQVLVASILRGSVNFKLRPDAGAYVEAAGSAFTASSGARFSVGVLDGKALLKVVSGNVAASEPGAQQKYILRPPAGQGGSISVAARATRQVQIQVTDENDRPVPDLAILFTLGDPCLGTLGIGAAAGTTFTEKTDRRGIATVPLIAGAAKCAGTLVAKVQGTDITYTYRVQVQSNTGFWNLQNSLIVAGIAAAGLTTGIILTNQSGDPIQPVPPPKVTP